MKIRKKITALLSLVIFFICAYSIIYKLGIMEFINTSIVYAKEDAMGECHVKGEYNITGEEEELYKSLSLDALKKYFDISIDNYNELAFRAIRINRRTIEKLESGIRKQLREAYDNNEISKQEYDKQMNYYDGGPKDSYAFDKKALKKLRHGRIRATWLEGYKQFQCAFNENTKELEEIIINRTYEKGEKLLLLDRSELEYIAREFIEKHDLCDVKNFRCIQIKEINSDPDLKVAMKIWSLCFKYGNKKIIIGIDGYTGDVVSFAKGDYADYIYGITK